MLSLVWSYTLRRKRDKSMMDQDLPLHSNQFDVGVDANDFKPMEFDIIK